MNAANGGFILNRYIPTDVTADYETVGFEITNAFDPIASLKYRAGNATATIRMTFETPFDLTGFALIRHNLNTSATVKLRSYTDGNFSTLIVENDVTVSGGIDTYATFINMNEVQYLELYISSDQDDIEIGVIYPGESFQFPRNYKWGFKRRFKTPKKTETSDYGIHFETYPEEQPEWNEYQIEFEHVDQDYFDQYKALIRPGKKIFIPSFTGPFCHYGIVANDALEAHRNRPGDTYGLEFFEDAITGGI